MVEVLGTYFIQYDFQTGHYCLAMKFCFEARLSGHLNPQSTLIYFTVNTLNVCFRKMISTRTEFSLILQRLKFTNANISNASYK